MHRRQAKRQKVQWNPQRVQLHPLHPPGYEPDVNYRAAADLRTNGRYFCLFNKNFDILCIFKKKLFESFGLKDEEL